MKLKIKNCKYFLNLMVKSTNELPIAINNCYTLIFKEEVERNSEI